ncbi:hypothetical protein ACFLTX_00715 [Chloroflexota bacterium]
MESFSRGWDFLKQSWQMVQADRDLIKPSFYALFAGFIVAIIFILPMALVGFITGGSNSSIGTYVMIFMGALLVFVQSSVSYVFSAMTIYLIFGYLSDGDGRMDKAWAIIKRDWLDILSLAAATAFVSLIKGFVKGKGRNKGRNFLSNLIDTVWVEAAFLILPSMVIEDKNLKDGLIRAGEIIKKNLLLVGISTVGIKAVNALISVLLGLFGLSLGFGISFGIVSLSGASTFGWISGISLGVFVAAIFFMLAAVISSYTATAYHTCLYLWACDIEKAEDGHHVSAPSPLAAVLEN